MKSTHPIIRGSLPPEAASWSWRCCAFLCVFDSAVAIAACADYQSGFHSKQTSIFQKATTEDFLFFVSNLTDYGELFPTSMPIPTCQFTCGHFFVMVEIIIHQLLFPLLLSAAAADSETTSRQTDGWCNGWWWWWWCGSISKHGPRQPT